jgi:catechol 2,3-dioxygenase-like lactoylglutathione lyase family enzyme
MSASLELGYPVLDVKTSDAKRAVAFYKQLGFENNGPIGPHVALQGLNRLVFMDWIPRNHINLRGPNIPDLARRLKDRGLTLRLDPPLVRDHPEAPECGAFSLFDPDGAELFFNTNPGERGPWETERWDWGYKPGAPVVPVTVPLGQVAVCVDSRDLEKSLRFYEALGCTPARWADGRSVVTFGPSADEASAAYVCRVSLLLRPARESATGLAFLCEDVDRASEEISRRGVKLDGQSFRDPDGRVVELVQMQSRQNTSSSGIRASARTQSDR